MTSDELPAVLWGKDAGGSTSKCKSNGATVVGLWVVYENGLEGYGVYGVTSSNWDADMQMSLVASSGFLESCGAPNSLYTKNKAKELIGWTTWLDSNIAQSALSCPIGSRASCESGTWGTDFCVFTNHLNLEHTVHFGSNWRAESWGWSRVRLRFYCSSTAVPCQ